MAIEKHLIESYLKKFDEVPFIVDYKGKSQFTVGKGLPKFMVRINKLPSKRKLIESTSLALGEAYMHGDIELEEGDLYFVLNSLLSQIDRFDINIRGLKKLLFTSVSEKNQKKEVCYHYNIGNDFYKLWLDSTMSYSCGYFIHEDDELETAQLNKIDHILKKLRLNEGMTLLDIGCGWGYLLMEAARKYKVKGIGITLSEEQYKSANEMIEKEGLSDYVEIKLLDYRELNNLNINFDRVVSVGMLEHVGRENYCEFFRNVDSVMKEGGEFLLHYISSNEESPGDPWIKKYIFPGGIIPSIREITSEGCEHGFHIIDVESLRLHYRNTLLCWYSNYENNIDKVREMFDEEFVRMWRIYLCSCAAVFNNGIVDVHQMLFTKGICNDIPLTRHYME